MSDMPALPIYAGPSFTLDRLREVKAGLDLPKAMPVDATYSTTERILAVGMKPPFLCDYYLVAETSNVEELQRALRWVLGTEADPNATLLIDELQEAMPGIREISPEEQESERRYIAYIEGTD